MNDVSMSEYMSTRVVHHGDSLAIVVDAFSHMQCQLRYWDNMRAEHGHTVLHVFRLLSHFHSDHYGGITSTWRHGRIYCSEGTAALVCGRLGVATDYVAALRFKVCYHFSMRDGALVSSHDDCVACPIRDACMRAATSRRGFDDDEVSMCFSIVLIKANHCPGAAMFLLSSAAFGVVLHTGDFRFNRSLAHWQSQRMCARRWWSARATQDAFAQRSGVGCEGDGGDVRASSIFYEPFIQDDALLQSVSGRVDTLFLDNTFCDTPYRFPSQLHVVQEVIAAVRANLLQAAREARARDANGARLHVSCAVVIGSYSIGKERAALEVQDAFCAANAACAIVPVYVHPYKYRMLQQLDYHVHRFVPLQASGVGNDRSDSAASLADADDGVTQAQTSPLPRRASAATVRKKRLRAVAAEVHEVLLPHRVDATAHDDADVGDVCYYLSIFLVPLWSVDTASLSMATRGLRTACSVEDGDGAERQTAATASSAPHDTARQLLFLGGDLGLDLSLYDRVLAVAPTGWMRRTSSHAVGARVTLLRVPYSEHSSFDELLDFVAFVNPRRVVPTVSQRQYAKHEAVFLDRAPRLTAQKHGSQPITRFFAPVVGDGFAPAAALAASNDTAMTTMATAAVVVTSTDPLLALTDTSMSSGQYGKRRRPVGARMLSNNARRAPTLAGATATAAVAAQPPVSSTLAMLAPTMRQATLFDVPLATARRVACTTPRAGQPASATQTMARQQTTVVVIDDDDDSSHDSVVCTDTDSDATRVCDDDDDAASVCV